MKKRILSAWLAVSMIITALPMFYTAAVAETGIVSAQNSDGKGNIDRSAYEALGFTNLNVTDDGKSFFGTGNTVLMPKKELFFNYNGSSNYGQVLRGGINLNRDAGGDDLQKAGGYQRYGQYQDPKKDWAHLDPKNGYNYGQLGGTDLYSSISSNNKHQRKAYATSVAFNSGDGRDSSVATVYLNTNSDCKRSSQNIVIEISDFTKNGKEKSSKSYIVENVGKQGALNESGYFYTMDYDALIDVAAGDFNGDGKDEIAVYAANNKIIIYRYSNGSLYYWKNIEASEISTDTGLVKNGDDSSTVKRAAVVSLQAFDLDKNNADELVVTVSNPQGTANDKYKNMNYGYIYGCNSEGKFMQSKKIPLYNDSTVLRYANSAAGDFTNNSRPILVFGGIAAKTSDPNSINGSCDMGTLTVSYNHSAKDYEVGNIQTHSGDFNSGMLTSGDKYYSPIGLAAFNMYGEKDSAGGCGERLFLFDRIYKYQDGAFSYDNTNITYGSGQKNNADEKRDKDKVWISAVITGNFTKQDIGRKEQLIAVIGQREKDQDKYWFQIAYISVDQNGNIHRGWEGVLNQATSYYNRTDKSREGAYLTVCAPDVDNDSMLLKFKGSETYYSKPEVQAIMQSAPYFGDVADTYGDYLNNGVTSYGKSKSSSQGVTASIETSLGVYTSEEASLGGAAEFEASIAAVASYEHESSWEKETEVEYAGGIGDDYVVMYTVPFHRYVYDGTDKNGKTVPVIIEEPMTPVTVIVTVDKYDEIAAAYSGLEPIRGNVLKSTPGDPSSYQTWGKGKFNPVGDVQMLTNAGKGNGSTVTVSQTSSYTASHSFSVGIEENLKAGGGAGFLGNNVKAGVVQSLTASVGGVFSNMSGVAYTGTVDNLPEGVNDFSFNWQLGFSEIKFNGEDIAVIGYRTTNVKRPPVTPQNFAVTDVANNTMTLEWDETSEAALYELSFVTANGEELPLATVPATESEDGVVSYTVKNLDPRTQYTFVLNACNAYGMRSLKSPYASGTTLSDGEEEFAIITQPQDKTAAIGHTVAFSVRAMSSSTEPIRYRWYRYNSDERSWEMTGSDMSDLTLTADESMDGSRYRCTVYQGTKVLSSKSAVLTLGRSPSKTFIAAASGGKTLSDNASVKADYQKNETVDETQTAWETVIKNGYTKMAAAESFGEDGSPVYSAPYIWRTGSGENAKYYADKNNAPDTEYTPNRTNVFTNDTETVKTEENLSTGLTAVTVADGKSTTSGYKIVGSGEYIYVYTEEVTDEENNKITVSSYYKKNSGGTFDEYLFDGSDETIIIESSEYPTEQFVEVKTAAVQTVKAEKMVDVQGDEITISATTEESDGAAEISKGSVNFRIVNTSSGSVESVSGVYDAAAKKWTANYRFPSAGVYEISAVYSGTEEYEGSISEKMTVFAYKDTGILSLRGGFMTYGGSLALSPTLIGESGSRDVRGAVYSVKKLEKTEKTVDGKLVTVDEWKDCALEIVNDRFTPDATGQYRVTAEYTDGSESISATASIEVAAKEVRITPNNLEGNLSESAEMRKGRLTADNATVTGMLAGDMANLKYTLTSDAVNARAKGEYIIEVTDVNTGDFSTKYAIVTERGIYNIKQNAYSVRAEASANGSVSISYVMKKYNSDGSFTDSTPMTVESGAQIPSGAKVTVSAQPSPGFKTDKWTVDGSEIANTANSYVIDSISKNTDIKVSFAYSLNTVTFETTDENGAVCTNRGTISGAYSDGQNFASGDTLTIGKKIILTAQPSDGFVVCGWQVYNTETAEWETIKTSDGTKNDTAHTRTISGAASSAAYRVMFAPKESLSVSFKVLDENGKALTSAEVLVNGESLAYENEKFEFVAYKHQNLDISVKVPDSVLIGYWTANGIGVAGNASRYTVYDIGESTDFVVYCNIPNTRIISFAAYRTDGTAAGEWGTLTAARVGGGAIVSGSAQPQSVKIEFTAQPSDGYRVQKWLLDGREVADHTQSSYTLTVDTSATVSVVFEKKPVITTSPGGVTAYVGSTKISNGGYVEFGDDVMFTIDPSDGYVVDTVTLNGSNITDALSGSADSDTKIYTASDVNTDQNLIVTYAKKPVVTVSCGNGGTIAAVGTADFTEKTVNSGDYVDFGSELRLEITPEFGFVIDCVTANGAEKAFTAANNSDSAVVIIGAVNADTAVEVSFRELKKYTFKFSVVDTNAEDEGGTNGAVTANISRKNMAQYADTISDSTNGTVLVYEGGEVVLSAAADSGYRIKEWTADGAVLEYSGEPFVGRTLTVDASMLEEYDNSEICVQFEQGVGRLVFMQPNGGVLTAVSAGAEFVSGGSADSTVEFTLVPDEHFVLKNWLLNGYILAEETGLSYIFTPDGSDATVAAVLEKERLDITAVADGEGRVDFPSEVRHGDTITISAYPSAGYEFAGWYFGGGLIDGADAVYEFTAENSGVYTARFVQKSGKTVSYSVNDESMGRISVRANGGYIASGATVAAGKQVVFTAEPIDGYRVKEWNGLPTDADISDDNLTATVSAIDDNLTVEAVFEKIPEYSITILAPENGTIKAVADGNDAVTVREGTEVAFTAEPDPYYMFGSWTNDAAAQTEKTFTMTVMSDITVGAVFEKAVYYSVKYSNLSPTLGTVSGKADGEKIAADTEVQFVGGSAIAFTAVPENGKMVKAWSVNGETVDNLSNSLEFKLGEPTIVTVDFEDLKLYKIPEDKSGEYSLGNIVRTPSDCGGEREIRDRGTVSFTVTAAEGKTITALSIDSETAENIEISHTADGVYSVVLTKVKKDIDMTVETADGVLVTVEPTENGTITVQRADKTEVKSGGAAKRGEVLTILTNAASGYRLSALSVNGNTLKANEYTVSDSDTAVVVSALFTKQSSGGSGSGGSGGGGSVSAKTYKVRFETNGGSAVGDMSVTANSKIKMPSDPTKDGYSFDGWYKDIELSKKYDFDSRVTADITLYAKWSKADGVRPVWNPFDDVRRGDWFEDAVRYVYENGLMNGTSATTFEPETEVSRAMFVTVLYRIENEPETKKTAFTDVEAGSWYENAVAWAEKNEIVNGVSETEFAPNESITREQMAAIVFRYAKFKGFDTTVSNTAEFKDQADISEYAKQAVEFLAEKEIILGNDDGRFMPQNNSTRAEAAAVFMRIVQTLKK